MPGLTRPFLLVLLLTTSPWNQLPGQTPASTRKPHSSTEASPAVQQLHEEADQAEQRGDLNTAIAKYEALIRIAPSLAPAYNNLGVLYFKQREFAKAAGTLQQALKLDHTLTATTALLGIAMFETADYTRARPLLESAVKANPKDGNAQLYLAKDLIKLGDSSAAAASLAKLTNAEPKNQEVFYLLARVYMQMSEQAFARMNAIDPDSVLSHQLSAEVMESMNNYDGAVVELKKAVAMAPNLPGNHYKLGDAYWNLSAWQQASEQFNQELQVSPGACMAEWKLGNILLQNDNATSEALDDLNQAIAACPNLSDAHVDRARALAKLNRVQDALADLEIAERTSPNDPSIHFLLSKAYRALGRTKEAAEELQQFSKLDEAARAATAERAQQVIQNNQAKH